MTYCERLSEQLAIVATIDPVALVGTTTTSDVFIMTNHRRALFILQTGAAFASATVLIQENNLAAFAGTTATLLTGLTTTVTDAASQYLYEVSAAALDHGYQWLRCHIQGANITDPISMVVLADVDRYKPASQYDLASVDVIQSTA
jgi:hypothetical protein